MFEFVQGILQKCGYFSGGEMYFPKLYVAHSSLFSCKTMFVWRIQEPISTNIGLMDTRERHNQLCQLARHFMMKKS